jgi:HEAT repeat protein
MELRMSSTNDYLEKLLEALSHWRALKRREAAYLLGEKRDPRAVPALITVLESAEDPFVKMEAATALGKIGGPHAIAALLKCLEPPQPLPARVAAVEALAHQPISEDIIAGLRRAAAHDPNEIVRQRARHILAGLGVRV